MLRRFVHIFLLLGFFRGCYGIDPDCTETWDIRHSCKRRAMIVMDVSSDMSTLMKKGEVFIISTSIIQQLDIRKHFISVGLATSGELTSKLYYYSDSRHQICDNLASLQKAVNSATYKKLAGIVGIIFNDYGLSDTTLVLMTNSSQEEVDAAGKLLQSYIREQKLLNFNAVVINFGKSSFRNWPKFASVYSGRFNPDYIAEYVGKQICAHAVDVGHASELPTSTKRTTADHTTTVRARTATDLVTTTTARNTKSTIKSTATKYRTQTLPTTTARHGVDVDYTSEDPKMATTEYTTIPRSTYRTDFDHTSEDPSMTSVEYTTLPAFTSSILSTMMTTLPKTFTSAILPTMTTSLPESSTFKPATTTTILPESPTPEPATTTTRPLKPSRSTTATTLPESSTSKSSTTTTSLSAIPKSSTSKPPTTTTTIPDSSTSEPSTTATTLPESSTSKLLTTTTTLPLSTSATPSTTSTTAGNTSTVNGSTTTGSRPQTSAPTLFPEPFAPTTTVDSMSPGPKQPRLPIADIMNSGCKCVLKTVWLDAFLLMEAGVAMTENGITSATDYIVSAFTKLTVGQAERFQTRLGVIRYASSVELIADLNVYTSTADLFDLNISLLNETGTNIEGAIRMATKKFLSSSHRRAARPVIIIVGSTYKDGGFNDPTQIAREFREDGGAIITIEYVQEHGMAVPMLRALASPNFSLTNKKMDGTPLRADELRQLLCEANCFCKKNWMPYRTNKWDAPHGGCYYPVPIPSIQILANRTCFRRNDAVLVLDEDSKKDAFLMSAFPPKTKFWLGLRYDGNQWTWPGGYSAGFTKWAPGQPNYRKGNCAYVQQYRGLQSAWFTDDCDNDHNYICQAKPCDSTKYCPAG